MQISKVQPLIYKAAIYRKAGVLKDNSYIYNSVPKTKLQAPLHFTSTKYGFMPDDDSQNRPELLEGQLYSADSEKVFTRSFTRFFRPDLNWNALGDYINRRFQDVDKVNTYVWGCSSGQEAYSLSMLLQKTADQADKFLPILALDIDKNIIEKNIQRLNKKIIIPPRDVAGIHSVIKYNTENYKNYLVCHSDNSVGLSEKVLDSVDFAFGNIVTDFEGITDDKNPSIVMCRNMWPYIDSTKYDKVVKTMYNKLAPGSIVVIGNYDLTGEYDYKGSKDFSKKLVQNGFKPVRNCALDNVSLIYEKPFEDTDC